MKRLLLVRHAKSDWKTAVTGDHDRPLSKRGRRAARLVGRVLSALDHAPDSVISSTATRAHDTVVLAAAAGGWSCPIRTTSALYEQSPQGVLAEVRAEPASTATLLIAGHEPTWSELTALLIGGGNIDMVTAAVARIDFATHTWREVEAGHGSLRWLLTPKALERAATSGLIEP